MAVSRTIPSPEFVEFDASVTRGLDLLGLRLPVQAIGNSLLNGITTITPQVRYLSFRTWLIKRYLTSTPPPPDRWSDFLRYAVQAEAVFALATLVRDRSSVGLVGTRKALRMIKESAGPYPVEPLAQQPAANAYARASDQLRLTWSRDSNVPHLGSEYGLPLAEAVEAAFSQTRIGQRLHSREPLGMVTLEELEEFGAVAWVGEVGEAERDALLAAILPAPLPQKDDLPRMATYAALLALAGGATDTPATTAGDNGARRAGGIREADLFTEALAASRTTPAVLANVLDGWALYAVRDAIAVTAEYTLDAVRRTIERLDSDGTGVRDVVLVRALVEDSAADQLNALRELGIDDASDDVASLPLITIEARLQEATSHGRVRASNGIYRWAGDMTEMKIYQTTPGLRDGCLVAGVLSWLMADLRAGEAVHQGVPAVDPLSHQGVARLGLRQVILPRLAEWRARGVSLATALAEYAHIVIDQHLRIAWTRLAQDPRKDVSVLVRDGDRITRRGTYDPGRTASRIDQAIGWLHQLGLLASGRLTPLGEEILARTLLTLNRVRGTEGTTEITPSAVEVAISALATGDGAPTDDGLSRDAPDPTDGIRPPASGSPLPATDGPAAATGTPGSVVGSPAPAAEPLRSVPSLKPGLYATTADAQPRPADAPGAEPGAPASAV